MLGFSPPPLDQNIYRNSHSVREGSGHRAGMYAGDPARSTESRCRLFPANQRITIERLIPNFFFANKLDTAPLFRSWCTASPSPPRRPPFRSTPAIIHKLRNIIIIFKLGLS